MVNLHVLHALRTSVDNEPESLETHPRLGLLTSIMNDVFYGSVSYPYVQPNRLGGVLQSVTYPAGHTNIHPKLRL